MIRYLEIKLIDIKSLWKFYFFYRNKCTVSNGICIGVSKAFKYGYISSRMRSILRRNINKNLEYPKMYAFPPYSRYNKKRLRLLLRIIISIIIGRNQK